MRAHSTWRRNKGRNAGKTYSLEMRSRNSIGNEPVSEFEEGNNLYNTASWLLWVKKISSKEKAYIIKRQGYEYSVWQSQKKKKEKETKVVRFKSPRFTEEESCMSLKNNCDAKNTTKRNMVGRQKRSILFVSHISIKKLEGFAMTYIGLF